MRAVPRALKSSQVCDDFLHCLMVEIAPDHDTRSASSRSKHRIDFLRPQQLFMYQRGSLFHAFVSSFSGAISDTNSETGARCVSLTVVQMLINDLDELHEVISIEDSVFAVRETLD